MQMDNSDRLQKKIKGAMIYPAVIISVVIIVGILMFIFVIPGLTATFKELNVELPFATRIIIDISDFIKNNLLLFLGSLIGLIALIYIAIRTKQGHDLIDTVILRLPFFGPITKEINSARTARTLSSLLTSGVPIAESLRITEQVLQNHYYQSIIKEAEVSISKGETISSVFIRNEKFYPVFVGEMMSVGEETGKMPDMLMGVATFYETEVDQKTKDMSTIIEPILMVIIGAAVGFFAIAMIMPIYSLMDNV
jgi:type IV pilus assembly protein PilC